MKPLVLMLSIGVLLCSPVLANDYKKDIFDTCLKNALKKAKIADEQKKTEDFCTCYAERLSTDPKISEATRKKLSAEYPKNINAFLGKPNLSNLDPEYEEAGLLMAVPFQCLEQIDPKAIKIIDEKHGENTARSDAIAPDPLPTPNYSRQTYSGSYTKNTAEQITDLFKKTSNAEGVSVRQAPEQQLTALLGQDGTAYYFTTPDHPAHPSYIKLEVNGGKGFPVYIGGYGGDKETFKSFFDSFMTAMNKQLGIQ